MTANDIRNIALLGHGGSGKTSLAEKMLFIMPLADKKESPIAVREYQAQGFHVLRYAFRTVTIFSIIVRILFSSCAV